MAVVTVADIKAKAIAWADMENSDFISPGDWILFIDSAYKELYDLLVSKFEDWFTDEPVPFTVAAGTNTHTLGSDFFKVRAIDRDMGGGNFKEVSTFNFSDRNQGAAEVRYRLVKNKLVFKPDTLAPGDYQIWQVPVATSLTDVTDTVDGVNGWEDFIAVGAAIMALTKEESDITALSRRKQELMFRINSMAQNRDMSLTDSIADVTSTDYYAEQFNGH